jgi:protein TonB
MLMTNHEIMSGRPSGLTPNRVMAMTGVGLLHVAAIYALISGMAAKIVKLVPPDLQVAWVDTVIPHHTVPIPPEPKMAVPTKFDLPTVPIPDVPNTDTGKKGINGTAQQTSPAPDHAAMGLSSTHSTPPYPNDARALSHQGTVLLQITVSPQGDVVAATVVQSSGFGELDQAAVSWVVAHWKYNPAILGGVPVTSQTQAAVKFDLKEAHR